MGNEQPFYKPVTVCYWNSDPRYLDAEKIEVEGHLARLASVQMTDVRSPEDSTLKEADLLIIAAQTIPSEEFGKWLSGIHKRMTQAGHIWVPALIVAPIDFLDLSALWQEIHQTNWYFDILSPAHVASVPMRVANLLRIHDHIRELHRYAEVVQNLQSKVTRIEAELQKMRESAQGGSLT